MMPPETPSPDIVVPLVVQMRPTTRMPLSGGTPGSAATPAQIMAFKNHVVSCAAVVTQMKELMAMSKNALAALPAADVEAVVVAGYPPPA